MNYVAAFRTYTWDDDVRELARRFFAACPSARQVVLADETRGPLGITEYELISHTEDTSGIGLIVEPPGGSLWYNVDYGPYILRDRLPGYAYYLTSESDLAVNADLEPMVRAAVDRGIDIVTHQVMRSAPPWHWHDNAAACFNDPWRSILFFMLMSDRAIDVLAAARRDMGAAFRRGELAQWPFCEPFVPSVGMRAGLSFSEISEFVDTTHLNYRPRIALDDPRANRPGALAHSVLGRRPFIRSVIAENEPRDFFFPGSDVHEALSVYPLEDYADQLHAAFAARSDHAAMNRFRPHPAPEWFPDMPDFDLALCKPSLVSSTSAWSRTDDPIREAAGANGAQLLDDHGFHTNREHEPWWLVDLLEDCDVHTVAIVNRAGQTARFVNFYVESSGDSHQWRIEHVKIDANEVSADPAAPHRIDFAEPFRARFVRIRLIGSGILHLRRIQIFGAKTPPENNI